MQRTRYKDLTEFHFRVRVKNFDLESRQWTKLKQENLLFTWTRIDWFCRAISLSHFMAKGSVRKTLLFVPLIIPFSDSSCASSKLMPESLACPPTIQISHIKKLVTLKSNFPHWDCYFDLHYLTRRNVVREGLFSERQEKWVATNNAKSGNRWRIWGWSYLFPH